MKNIVITGSTRGIGLGMAMEFLKKGCCVTLSGRETTLSATLEHQLKPFFPQWHYCFCDVQRYDDLQNLWIKAKQRWGQVDIWINNAGCNTPYEMAYCTQRMPTKQVIQTNLLGMIYGSQIAAYGMIKQGFGAIYSMEGLGSNQMIQKKTILYGTTKAALTYFMKGLAKEMAETHIIVGRLFPGMARTDFITKNVDGSPSKVLENQQFKKIFQVLSDEPEIIAHFLVRQILANKKNNQRIVWLTNRKVAWRFLSKGFGRSQR